MIKIILLSLISTVAFALDVEDPSHYLNQLNGTQNFSQAWSCPQQAHVYSGTGICSVNCTTANCISRCQPVTTTKSTMFTQTCTADGLDIYGDQGLEFNVTSKDYAANNQNWALIFLQQSAQFFSSVPTQITINFFMPQTFIFVENGNMQNIFADVLVMDIVFQPGTMAYTTQLVVNPNDVGLNQILKFSAGSDILYQRKGVFDAQNPQ